MNEQQGTPTREREHISDDPIRTKGDDRLGRAPFAVAVAQVIRRLASGGSTVVGIYGGWGEGKTSVLYMLEEELSATPNIRCARFNPWRFRDEDEQLKQLFEAIARAADAKPAARKRAIGKWLRRMSYLLRATKVSSSATGGELSFSPGEPIEEIARKLEHLSLEQLRDLVGRGLVEAQRKVVVLIDDVDRLSRHEIQGLIRLLKLSCDFDNTVYVLACDDHMVACAIGEQYGSGDVAAGRAFLEKVVHVPLPLPAPDGLAMVQHTFGLLNEVLDSLGVRLAEADKHRFVQLYRRTLEPECRTLRQAKRYANTVAITLGLIRDEINAVDFLLLEGLRVFYPTMYLEMRANLAILVEPAESGPAGHRDNEAIRALVERGSSGLSSSQREAATALLTALFPFAGPATGGRLYARELAEEWTRERRLTSKRHCSRYFALQVPLADVSERDIDTVLGLVRAGEMNDSARTLRRLVTEANASNVLQRLGERGAELGGPDVGRLAVTIAHSADRLSHERAVWFDTGDIAAIMVRNLLRRIPHDDRVEWLRQVLSYPTPVIFAVECARGLLGDANEAEVGHDLSAAADAEMQRVVLDRVVGELNTGEGELPSGAVLVMLMSALAWWGDADSAKRMLRHKIEMQPTNAVKVLLAYAGRSIEMESGIASVGSIRGDAYHAIAAVLSPEVIVAALDKLYGVGLVSREDSQELHRSNASDELRVAREFVGVHDEETGSKSGPTEAPPPLGQEPIDEPA